MKKKFTSSALSFLNWAYTFKKDFPVIVVSSQTSIFLFDISDPSSTIGSPFSNGHNNVFPEKPQSINPSTICLPPSPIPNMVYESKPS